MIRALQSKISLYAGTSCHTIWSTQQSCSAKSKWRDNPQETNISAPLILIGSSETTRETASFLQWFIGFTEGDGSFIVNKTGYLEFKVTQSSIDAQVLFYIKKQLGFGSVSIQDKERKTHQFRVRDKTNLLKLIHIFNGHLYTDKKNHQFKLWLAAFNQTYSCQVPFLANHQELSLSSAPCGWLAGFSDAEGCFTVSVLKRSINYTQVTVRFILAQKGEFALMSKIALLFNGKVSAVKSYDGYNMVVNFSQLGKVIAYFKQFPLKTKKHIDYLNWLKVYELVLVKKHLRPDGLVRVMALKEKINKKNG